MEYRELRLAMVMTGGVSLAVWMGGVSAEVFRAMRKEGLYGDLCDLTATDLVVDVIAGASAGGLNGALLGTAIARDLTPAKFDELRNLWLRVAGFEELLRSPFKANPPSLLKGDDFFTPQLCDVLRDWLGAGSAATPPEDEDLTVVLTASLLTPELKRFADDFGTPIIEPVHRGQFKFTGSTFRDTDHLAERLALAARTSASFPGAFEASYIPVGEQLPNRPDMARVADFKRSHWAVDGGVLMNKPVKPALDAIGRRPSKGELRRVVAYVNPDPGNRVVPDLFEQVPTIGQVILRSLVTLPRTESIAGDLEDLLAHNQKASGHRNLRDALLRGIDVVPADGTPQSTDAVGHQPRAVRRYVPIEASAELLYPYWVKRSAIAAIAVCLQGYYGEAGVDPGRPTDDRGVTFADLRIALEQARADVGWLPSNLPTTNESSDAATPDGVTATNLDDPSATWRWGAEPLQYIVQLLLDLIHRAYRVVPLTEEPASPAGSLREVLGATRARVHVENAWLRLLRACEEDYWRFNLAHLKERTNRDCPTTLAHDLHADWPLPPQDLRVEQKTATGEPEAQSEARLLRWALLRRLQRGADMPPEGEGARAQSPDDVRRGLEEAQHAERRRNATIDAAVLRGLVREETNPEILRRQTNDAEMRIARRLTDVMLELRATIDQALELAVDVPAVVKAIPECPPLRVEADSDVLRELSAALFRDIAPLRAPLLLRRLLCLYVVHASTVDEMAAITARTEFVQISALSPNFLDPSRTLPQQKVAGLQVGHFGGFLKASWRANDWMWGTLDGASRLVLLLVEPARLRQRWADSKAAVEAIGTIVSGESPHLRPLLTDVDRAYLAAQWEAVEDAVGEELTFLDRERGAPLPRTLPATVAAVTKVLQMTIARRELPVVGASVIASAQRGAALPYDAIVFTELLKRATGAGGGGDNVPLASTSELLRNCRVGLETAVDEVGSDQGASTAAQAAAVATTAVAGTRSGLGPLRAPVASVRVAVLGVYLMVASAARKTRAGFAFATFILAVAASAVAARLLGADIANPVIVAACVLLAAWLLYTGASVHSWAYSITGVLVLGVVALSFIDEAKVCAALATTCSPVAVQPGWKGTVRWLVPSGLAVMSLMLVLAWWRERSERRIQDLTAVWSGASEAVPRRYAGRLLLWAIVLAALSAAQALWINDLLFSGDGTTNPRRRVIDLVEMLSRNRAIVTLVVLPGVFIGLSYLRSLVRSARDSSVRRKALERARRTPLPTS